MMYGRIGCMVVLFASVAWATVDLDQNGISDIWAALYPAAGLPGDDPDGDGADNSSEAAAGTNPHDEKSCFKIGLAAGNGNDLAIDWDEVAGKRYRYARSFDLLFWQAFDGTFPGLAAYTSLFCHVSVADFDTDGDRLNDWEDLQTGTSVTNPDTDADGMPDGWEVIFHLNPLADDAFVDLDGDLWDNLAEYEAETNPERSNSIAVPAAIPVLTDAMAAVLPQVNASYAWTIAGGDFTEGNGSPSIHFVAGTTGHVYLGCSLSTGSPPTVVGVYTAQVEAIAVPLKPEAIVPGFVTAAQTGIVARVIAQTGAAYAWTITNGIVTSGSQSNSIVFTAGATGLVTVVCAANLAGSYTSGVAVVHVLPPSAPAWETPLSQSSLPPLTLNVANDPTRLWMFANMLRSSEAWIMKPDSSAAEAAQMARQIELDENGWPLALPPGAQLEMNANYMTGPTSSLHGAFVLTWEGHGLVELSSSRNDGLLELELLNDQTNGRIVKSIQTPEKYPWIFVRSTDPADPVRNMRLWAPAYDGAGRELTAASNLAPGHVTGSLEPAPGQPEPMWHPRYLQHLNESPQPGAFRFMGWQQINKSNWERAPVTWNDRAHSNYCFNALVTLDRAYNRYSVTAYRQRMGLPFEWMIDLCNELGKDLWIQIPHTATEEVARNLAALCAARLDPALRVWFEFSNEIWNGFGPYLPQQNYAQLAAALRFNVPLASVDFDQLAWGSGYRQGQALKAFEDEWRARGMPDERLINVAAGFAMNSGYNAQVLAAIREIAPDLPEALAITTYFGADTQFEIFGSHDFGANPGVWPESLYESTKRCVRQNLYGAAAAWKSSADVASAAGAPLVCYEGGQHMLPLGFGDWNNPDHVDFMNYMYSFQRSRQIGELYREQYALWNAMGGRSGDQFVDASGWSFWGYWGAKEYVTQTRAESPKWEAFCAWNELMDGVRAPSEPIGSRPVLPELNLRGEALTPMSHDFTAVGGDGAVQIRLVGGALPPGMTLSQTNSGAARIVGTPAADGLFRFVLVALDADKDPDFKTGVISVDPAGSASNALVVFRGQDIPATLPNNGWIGRYDAARPYTEVRNASNDLTRLYLPFSIADGQALFGNESLEVEGTPQVIPPDSPLNMYGGWSVTAMPGATNMSGFIGLRDYQWSSWSGDGAGGATELDALLLWRAMQFNALGGSGNYRFGAHSTTALLQLDMTELFGDGQIEIRFVVLDGATYYLSEAAHDTLNLGDGYFQLADFSGNAAAGKRWSAFAPTAGDYAIPETNRLSFAAHAFTNVQAVGVAIHGGNPSWHKSLNFSRFIALGQRP